MKLPIPGPAHVLHAAGGLRSGVTEALDLLPRVVAAMGQLEQLLDRAGALVDRVEAVAARAEEAIAGVDATRQRADEAISAVGRTNSAAGQAIDAVRGTNDAAGETIDAVRETNDAAGETIEAVRRTNDAADAAVTTVGGTAAAADGTLDRAERMLGTVAPLLEAYRPALTALEPAVTQFVDQLDAEEVQALITLVDRLPVLMQHLDEDVLPVLASLDNVAPDVHDLLDTVEDMRQVVKGFPGSKLFRRRGAEEIAQEESEEDDAGQDEADGSGRDRVPPGPELTGGGDDAGPSITDEQTEQLHHWAGH